MWAFESLPEHDTALTQVLQGSEPFLLLLKPPCPQPTLLPPFHVNTYQAPPVCAFASFYQGCQFLPAKQKQTIP